MVYFFLGTDSAQKDIRIEKLKASILKSVNARQFDYESLSAHKLHKDTLKKSLDTLPVSGKQRFLIIREVEKLDKYNKDLSQRRAQSCVDYLIEKGIETDRMESKGYGEELLLVTDEEIEKLETEEEREDAHQKNRRTEFRILRDNYVPKPNTE